MHTVVETASYLNAAKAAGMSEEETAAVAALLAANPSAGAPMAGTGGCRKLRIAKPGQGKSGGYRVVTFYSGENIPVFLLTVFGKSEKDNLTKAERNALLALTTDLVSSYAARRRRR